MSIVAETTPLRIVSHCSGNPTKREFNSYCPKAVLWMFIHRSCRKVLPAEEKCKIANCKGQHPTVLHTSPCERPAVDVGVGTEDVISTQVCSHIVKTGTSANSETAREGRRTGMAVIPVRVRVKDSDKSVITYAFLDNGSNSSFCTESLMKQLGINGQQGKISMSTLEKKNSIINSFLVRNLLVSDFDKNEWNSLPTLYTRPEIPVSSSDIPTQDNVNQWPHLQGVFLPRLDADVGLLIASDVPKAFDPLDMKHSQDSGPYALIMRITWAVNGPLGRRHHSSRSSTFVAKVDHQLQQMIEDFYNRDFTDPTVD